MRLDFKEGVIDLVPLADASATGPSADVPVLIVLDPILFDPAVLVEKRDSLAAWLHRRGSIVYLTRNLSRKGDAFDAQPAMIAAICDRVRQAHPLSRIFLLGIGPGARPILSYAAQFATGKPSILSGIVLIGTGLDSAPSPLLSTYPDLSGSDLREVCTPGRPCYPFVRPEMDKRGFRLRRFPDVKAAPAPDVDRLESLDLPLLLIVGRGDPFTTVESTSALRSRYGQKGNCAFSTRIESCALFVEAGKEMGFARDYDLFDLVLSEDAPDEIFRPMVRWVEFQAKAKR